MQQEDLNKQWQELAPAWIKEAREGLNPTRTGLLDKPMLEACGDVRGLRALDCGCGEGRFCRILTEKGAAYALGLDLCAPMIDAAEQLQGEKDEYRVANVQDLSFLDSGSFDLAVSYLNQCDLPDFMANTREVYRVLKPGGRFVVANLHPMRSSVGTWHRDQNGNKLHVIVDNYFDESERHWRMHDTDFTNFHRSLQTYIRAFLNTGFTIADIAEPTVEAEALKQYPQLDDDLRVPNFIIYVLDKQ